MIHKINSIRNTKVSFRSFGSLYRPLRGSSLILTTKLIQTIFSVFTFFSLYPFLDPLFHISLPTLFSLLFDFYYLLWRPWPTVHLPFCHLFVHLFKFKDFLRRFLCLKSSCFTTIFDYQFRRFTFRFRWLFTSFEHFYAWSRIHFITYKC